VHFPWQLAQVHTQIEAPTITPLNPIVPHESRLKSDQNSVFENREQKRRFFLFHGVSFHFPGPPSSAKHPRSSISPSSATLFFFQFTEWRFFFIRLSPVHLRAR
jgi:hypothetical protein